jgi:class 3 adenylate cyclase
LLQVFAVSVEHKSHAMKRQKRKQEALIYKMLPKAVVDKLSSGLDTAETFESATLFFSTVVDFNLVTKKCKAMDIVNFLNNLYSTMDDRMDTHDVYKVETISDSYLVASGLPKKNGDRYDWVLGQLCFWPLGHLQLGHLASWALGCLGTRPLGV